MNFMKKIPPGAEASNVLVGEVDFLERPIIAFIRLIPAVLLNGLTEVPVPTRWTTNRHFCYTDPGSEQCLLMWAPGSNSGKELNADASTMSEVDWIDGSQNVPSKIDKLPDFEPQ